jgi:hypothetical protein
VNELQWERLENLVTNPYTWVLFVFAMSLPYVLKFSRRFYPKKLQEKMKKEEACTLEFNQKPKIKFLNKVMVTGMASSIVISYLITYHLLSNVEKQLSMFVNLLASMILLIVIIIAFLQSKVKNDKNCNDVVVGYKFIKIVGIIEIIFIFVMGILYLFGYVK